MASYFLKRLERYFAGQGLRLPKETESVLDKTADELNPEEAQWYAQKVEPYLGYIWSCLEAIYKSEGSPDLWSKKLRKSSRPSIIERLAGEVVASHTAPPDEAVEHEEPAEGEIVSDGSTLQLAPGDEHEECAEEGGEEAPAATILLQREEATSHREEAAPCLEGTEGMGQLPEGGQQQEAVLACAAVPAAETVLQKVEEGAILESGKSKTALARAAKTIFIRKKGEARERALQAEPGTVTLRQPEGTPGTPLLLPMERSVEKEKGIAVWLKRHKVAVIISAAAVVLAGTAAFLTVFLFLGRKQVVYEWSRSERIGYDLRVERSLLMEKNAGDSPYRFMVELKIENQGDIEIGVLQVGERLPSILARKGDLIYDPEPARLDKEALTASWEKKGVKEQEALLISYYLPLQAELSRPQLDEIEEQFESAIVAFIGLPENQVQCDECGGAGSATCTGCNGMGSTICAACGGVGNVTCSSCGGKGSVKCPTCDGYGYYWRCATCGHVLTYSERYSWSYCHYCGKGGYVNGPYSCTNCGGTGTARCSTCGGSGRMTCRQCGGSGRLTCAACGGSGKIACGKCGGSGKIAFTYGESEIFTGQQE